MVFVEKGACFAREVPVGFEVFCLEGDWGSLGGRTGIVSAADLQFCEINWHVNTTVALSSPSQAGQIPSFHSPVTPLPWTLRKLWGTRSLQYVRDKIGTRFETISCFSIDRKSTRLHSSHKPNPYAFFCLKKKNTHESSEAHGTTPNSTGIPKNMS